ncbi:unnamed protein product [Cylindrotheca closterium]|uniref:Uncharacterized protein n=1 Tax=Cylindrotheca closterium TaxID=2856 RepID=A0AAD2G9G6_9STRA|nr:unnamed protein product [Cylindrotheca closterium]
MDFCGCGEDIALKQMFSEEEPETFSTSDSKTVDPASNKPVASRSIAAKPCVESRQEDIVVETVDSDGTMERQTVFNPKGREDAPPIETENENETETEAAGVKKTKTEAKKGNKKLFKLPKLGKKRSNKK